MMNTAWLTWMSPAPSIRIVAWETSSRRLHTSLATAHWCDASFRAFWECCRKYSLIGFFKARRRSIILTGWSTFSSGHVSQGRGIDVGAGGAEGGGVDFLYFTIFIYANWKSNEAKGTPNVSITKHSNESRRYASNLNTKSFTFKYHTTPENTKY